MDKPLAALQRRLDYHFKKQPLLSLALTHRSADRKNNNERLEFIGDACLNFVVGEYLFENFERAPEGTLSRLRAKMVCEGALARCARRLELGDYLMLGPGELKAGGHQRDSILADALEAIIGAIYLDQGFDTARKAILGWFHDDLSKLSLKDDLKDPKTRLQEFLQAGGRPLPTYTVESIEGPPHQQLFTVTCEIKDDSYRSTGRDRSRRRAEQQAAASFLEYLKNE